MIYTKLVAILFMQWHYVDQIKVKKKKVRTEIETELKIIINLLSKCPAKIIFVNRTLKY